MKKTGLVIQFIAFGIVALSSATPAAAQVTLRNVQVTDVTPFGFSVIWEVSEPAVPTISIFSDPLGAGDITSDFEITAFPMLGGNPLADDQYQAEQDREWLQAQARSKGMMKIMVHGCAPATTYYFKVHADTGAEMVSWPLEDPAEVTTTMENTFVSDAKQLLISIIDSEASLDATGWLVTVSSAETLYPVAGFVGDGADSNQAYLNLSRLFGMDGLNWAPLGAKDLEIQIIGPPEGPAVYSISLDFSEDFAVTAVYPLTVDMAATGDRDGDGLPNSLEDGPDGCPSSIDADSDDDGLADGVEDANQDGVVDPGETDPCNADSDGDGVMDGTELGVVDPVADPDGIGALKGTDPAVFQPDENPATTTDPLLADSDGDGVPDGVEDSNANGTVESWETDPASAASTPAAIVKLTKGFNVVSVHNAGELREWLGRLGGEAIIDKIMAYDPSSGKFFILTADNVETFSLSGTESILVYAKAGKQIALATAACTDVQLVAGFNLATFACSPGDYSAFDLLADIGSTNILGVQRFHPATGTFQSASFNDSGQTVGIDFPITPAEGYYIFMKQNYTWAP